jgi:hypothetical protein
MYNITQHVAPRILDIIWRYILIVMMHLFYLMDLQVDLELISRARE